MKKIDKAELEKARNEGFKRGVECAADIARGYNSSSTHPYDLGDCILGKLNQIGKRKPRKNTARKK